MKLAVIGSRNLKNIVIDGYIPDEAVEIISGGAEGVDTLAAEYAKKKGLRLTVFLPQYEHYGFAAPIVRNKAIKKTFMQTLWLIHKKHLSLQNY